MAFSALGLAGRIHLNLLRHPFDFGVLKVRIRYSLAIESVAEPFSQLKEEEERISFSIHGKENNNGERSSWKKLNSKELGIETTFISKPTRLVLNGLRKKGYEVYLVGGCVRDLILRRIPKDFDIITSADLREVQKVFSRCEIVGNRFPICHVHVYDTIIEVSSFSTSRRQSGLKLNNYFNKPYGCDGQDFVRWRNCSQRDFTINSLMFDPYAKIVYDYLGAMEDIRKSKVRTIVPANHSFSEDCARILRAVRIAARLGFHFTRDIALSIKELSGSVLKLDKGRILMEINYMLAFGSAESSLRLLWRFGLLDILLPIQASYFVSMGFRRRDERSNMLLCLFSNLDKLVAPDRPCHSSLWIAILAFHKALVDRPRDLLVVSAFCLAVHSGGSLSAAIEIARNISQPHSTSFYELLETTDIYSDSVLIEQVIDLAASVKDVLCQMTDPYYISQAMAKYPQAPSSNLVFISQALSLKVCNIFECVRSGKEGGSVSRRRKKIDYESLAWGNLQEVQHMFARIVFDTIYPLNKNQESST